MEASWNQFCQYVVQIPFGMSEEQVIEVINLDELNYLQGDLYESFHYKKKSLFQSFNEIV